MKLPAPRASQSPGCRFHRTVLTHRQKDLVEAAWTGERATDFRPVPKSKLCHLLAKSRWPLW